MKLETRILILISFIVAIAGRVITEKEEVPRAYEPPSKLDYEKVYEPPAPRREYEPPAPRREYEPPAPRREDKTAPPPPTPPRADLINELNKTELKSKLSVLENCTNTTSGVWAVNQTTNVTDYPEEQREDVSAYWSADDEFERSSAELMGLLFPFVSLLLKV